MKEKLLLILLLCIVLAGTAQTETLYSPDGYIKVMVDCSTNQLQYSVQSTHPYIDSLGNAFIMPSEIGIELDNGTILGRNPKVTKIERKSVDQEVTAHFYKKAKIQDRYNELIISFKGNFKVIFRVYNSGIAYRFVTNRKDSLVIKHEMAEFNFPANGISNMEPKALIPYVNRQAAKNGDFSEQLCTSFENTYVDTFLHNMANDRLAFLPMMVKVFFMPRWESNLNNWHVRTAVITEADLRDYPGMYLKHTKGNSMIGYFAPLPKTWEQGGHNNLQYVVKERENYIAKTAGTRAFPWRVIAIATEDKDLANNDLVYLLSESSKVADISWIKPGKVAWDWWNNWNIWGVDFKAGINNETYKYYIDFAAEKGIEYVILDEGWAVNKQADLFQVVPEIDLPMLVKYAESKGVGIVLWAGYAAMDKEMERVCKHYSEMGVKGFKVDFMDRDDQIVVNFYERMAATAAKYHLFIDFHGAYKPTGLSRTYPNVLNYEGVFGLEQCKWVDSKTDMVKYEVTIPFIRMLAGPMDFTQGAMRNAAYWCYFPSWNEPMSQGTRCRQLAEYVIFDAPFAMLCDAPTAYMQEPECTDFIAKVPTVWDETRILDGKVGKYIVTAKRKGNTWYIGTITDWNARTIEINLKELGITSGSMTMFVDGPNAHRKGIDYQKKTMVVPADGKLSLELAPGGGAAVTIDN
ncbi:MAG: glycoside hydrolase family 97 protein [Bacteroidales bacterium]|nr:glycoside hydrolase family 97 protein [Bacteroidales bacterium]